MPTTHHSSLTPCTTFLICCGFFLALFPSLFVSLTWSPGYYFFPPEKPVGPPVLCYPPYSCEAPGRMAW